VKTIESLRFASGDEDIRSALYDELGEPLFENFDKVQTKLEKLVNEWGNGDDEEESEEGAAKRGLPEKKKKRLLEARTWERDARLVETATALRKEIGEKLFEDHNVFRERVDEALEKLKIKLSASDLKLILRAVSWRIETAPPVIAKVHKPGKMKADPLRGLYSVSLSASGGE
jgi:type I restriction enzyme M protein